MQTLLRANWADINLPATQVPRKDAQALLLKLNVKAVVTGDDQTNTEPW